MTTYTIELSEAEDLALRYVSNSAEDWINNAVKERCRVAVEEIVKITVEKCLESELQIPSSKDEMVLLAYEKGWVKTAKMASDQMASSTSNG